MQQSNNTTASGDDPAGFIGSAVTTAMEQHQGDPATVRRQTEALLDEIALATKQQALTSEKKPLSSLEALYQNRIDNEQDGGAGDAAQGQFLPGVRDLAERYSHIRTIRGDGNCYYRAFLYSLLEQQFEKTNDIEGRRLWDYFQNQSWKDILSMGYDEMALEIFHDEIVELVQRVLVATGASVGGGGVDTASTTPSSPPFTAASFHDAMNKENDVSDYATWYLRVVTATHLKRDPERFYPFCLQMAAAQDDGVVVADVAQFCAKYIEPMGQECEHVQVLALAEAVGVLVRIEYLDGRPSSSSNSSVEPLVHAHTFGPETSATKLTLLYRPGHYDILYPK
jgi:ubiquitin thioesterase protein OTUB1